jgi:hypothetical protein
VIRYYDRQGNPMALSQWAKAFRDEDRIVARETVRGATASADVSTVWLGLDHQFFPGGPPLIFETMVFGGPLDQEQVRYSTEAQAHAGHAEMLDRVRAALAAA